MKDVLGQYPTPLELLHGLSRPGKELWVKRDDLTSPLYGGNKVRKLDYLFWEARRQGKTRIVTMGAAGSHHVLATTLHARARGLPVAALLLPQIRTEHAVNNLRASLAAGLIAIPVAHPALLAWKAAHEIRSHDFWISPGGSSVVGAMGYVDAVEELVAQIGLRLTSPPDAIVVALGSGGTAAGILAGVSGRGVPSRVVAVRVVHPLLAGAATTIGLAHQAARRWGRSTSLTQLGRHLQVEGGFLGRGYGYPSDAGRHAMCVAKAQGLVLEPTYTAKAFAAALHLFERTGARRVLFWHTFSSVALDGLLDESPPFQELPPRLQALFVDP